MNPFSPEGCRRASVSADWLAAAVFAALPWSTSATGILITAWLVAVLLTLDRAVLREHLPRPAVYLPLLLWVCMGLATLWADTSWATRLNGLEDFQKLLVLPLLVIHFSRSPGGILAFGAFVVSSVVLLVYSWASIRWPGLVWGQRVPGVPVKDYIYQNMCFVLSACVLLHLALTRYEERRFAAVACIATIIALFLASTAYVATSRTAMVALPILLVAIGYQRFGLKGVVAFLAAFAVVGAAIWVTSPQLQTRLAELVEGSTRHVATEEPSVVESSEALRLEFWRKSVAAIADRPLLGHGTGSIADVFARYGADVREAPDVDPRNPHNQTFAVGIQAGLAGMVLLFLMWIAYLRLFSGSGWAAWFGLLVVLQNIIGSAFNSHLSDFTAGWLYVFGVGVLGGTVLQQRARACASNPP